MPDRTRPPDADRGTGEAPPWTAADTEPVLCCLCGVAGDAGARRPPVRRGPVPGLRAGFRLTPVDGAVPCSGCTTSRPTSRAASTGTARARSPAMVLQRTWTAGRLARLARLASAARSNLLEIGSGYGLFLAAARDAGYQVRGVELSRTGVRRTPGTGSGWTCSAANSPTRRSTPADVICFWDTLEHVPDPLVFLRQVRRRLAPDGVFALSVPYFSSVPARVLRRAVVDAQARAAHLAFHPGDAAAGRRQGRPGDHVGDPLAAAAGQRRPAGFAGGVRPGPARPGGAGAAGRRGARAGCSDGAVARRRCSTTSSASSMRSTSCPLAVAASHGDPGVPAAAMTHAWLFTGPPGSGRSVAARAFAAALQCAEYGGCGHCSHCRTVLPRTPTPTSAPSPRRG